MYESSLILLPTQSKISIESTVLVLGQLDTSDHQLRTSCPTPSSVFIILVNVFFMVSSKNPQLLTHTAPELHHTHFRLFSQCSESWDFVHQWLQVSSYYMKKEKKVYFKATCRIWSEAESHFLHRCCLGRGFGKQKGVQQRDHTQTRLQTCNLCWETKVVWCIRRRR